MNSVQLLARAGVCGILLGVFTAFSSAQEESDRHIHPNVSVGVRGGFAWPLGDWKAHRFAPVDQFQGGLTVGGDLEIRLTQQMCLGIVADYTRLDVGEWEDYAASRGDDVTASASVISLALTLKPHLIDHRPSVLSLDIGFAIAFPSGKEQSDRFVYEYDFLRNPGFGALLGLEYAHLIGDNFAVTIRAAAMFIFSGIGYADGIDNNLTLAPVTGGVRFYF